MEVQRGAILPAKKDRLWPKTHTGIFDSRTGRFQKEKKRKRANQPSMRWPLAWQEKWAIIKKGHQQQQQSTNVRLKHKCNKKTVCRRSLRPSLRLSSLSFLLSLILFHHHQHEHISLPHLLSDLQIFRHHHQHIIVILQWGEREPSNQAGHRQVTIYKQPKNSLSIRAVSEWVSEMCSEGRRLYDLSAVAPLSLKKTRKHTMEPVNNSIKSEISVNNRHAAWSVSIDWPREKQRAKECHS